MVAGITVLGAFEAHRGFWWACIVVAGSTVLTALVGINEKRMRKLQERG